MGDINRGDPPGWVARGRRELNSESMRCMMGVSNQPVIRSLSNQDDTMSTICWDVLISVRLVCVHGLRGLGPVSPCKPSYVLVFVL
jgi:hypothetical protein